MEILLLPTVWLPIMGLALLGALARWTNAPKRLFLILGWLLVIMGSLLALFGMGVRAAIVPSDYAGWSEWETWKDQIFVGVAVGGASIFAGLTCILRIAR